jgi:hypothetical protein
MDGAASPNDITTTTAAPEQLVLQQPPVKAQQQQGHAATTDTSALPAAAAPTLLSHPLRMVDPDTLPSERLACGRCGRRHLHYCPDCMVPAVGPGVQLPSVRLPLRVHILRGKEERASKSTSTHAAVLAPQDVTVYYLPEFPVYERPERVLVLYPSPTSVPVTALDPASYDTVIVLDTTWNKAGSVLTAREFMGQPFTFVHLAGGYHTLFWRHQPLGPSCVSTLEALYFFLREWHCRVAAVAAAAAGTSSAPAPAGGSVADEEAACATSGSASGAAAPAHGLSLSDYDGRFDNLLLFFLYTYRRIQHEYTQGQKQGRAFHRRMREGYIAAGGAADAGGGGDGDEDEAAGECEGEDAQASRPAKRARMEAGGTAAAPAAAGGGRPDRGQPRLAKGAWTVKTDFMTPAAAALLQRGIDLGGLSRGAPMAAELVPAAAANTGGGSGSTAGSSASTGSVAEASGGGAGGGGDQVIAYQRVVARMLHSYGQRLDEGRGTAAAAAAATTTTAAAAGPASGAASGAGAGSAGSVALPRDPAPGVEGAARVQPAPAPAPAPAATRGGTAAS